MDEKYISLLEKIDKKVDLITFQIDNYCVRLNKVEVDINGNGKEGIKDKQNRMETESKTEIRTIKWIGGIISFVLSIFAFLNIK